MDRNGVDATSIGNFRKATLIYAGALALIATLSMITHVMVDAIVQRQEATARVVNVSGRQRMLSQRIAMMALELSRTDAQIQNAAGAELAAAIDLMDSSHRALQEGSKELGISPDKSPAISAVYNAGPHRLNARVTAYLEQARGYLALSPQERPASAYLAEIQTAAHGPILQALDAAVKQYEADSEEAIRQLRRILLSLVGMMLATLGAEAIFIFRPLFRKLESAHMKLLDAARTDPLTGCMNRRYLMEAAAREMARIKRSGSTLAVLMIDIDHFKHINDAHGHAVGDEALLTLVRILIANIRASDMLGRIGGEEFAVILPDTSPETALQVAEKLRESIAAAVVKGDGLSFSMTASIGLAELKADETDFLTALERADKALYKAKQSGRNRVEVFTADLAAIEGKGF
ncbi:MAG: diguanylate cyclase [Rhodospirillales bacterium]|nr:diguanylate cyclase [Rhodospirillales bacterium]